MNSEKINNSFNYPLNEWTQIHANILRLEEQGLVKRTFRRLDPGVQKKIIHAILDEAALYGPLRMNIRNIAKRSRISVGAVYTYFKDKKTLLNFTVMLCTIFIIDMLNNVKPYLIQMPIKEAIKSYLTEGIKWSRLQLGFFKYFARAAYQGDPDLTKKMIKPVSNVMLDVVKAIIVAAVERGELKSNIDTDATSRIINTLLIVTNDSMVLPYLNSYFCLTSKDVGEDRMIKALINIIFNGIANEKNSFKN